MKTQSESIGQLAAAMVQFAAMCPPIKADQTVSVKTRAGGSYSFQYASMTNLMAVAKPLLHKCNLALSQLICGNTLVTLLMHESGEYLQSTTTIPIDETMDNSIQAFGSALSYMRRYAAECILNIQVEQPASKASVAAPPEQPKQWVNQYTDASNTTETEEWRRIVRDMATDKPHGQMDKSSPNVWIYTSMLGKVFYIHKRNFAAFDRCVDFQRTNQPNHD